MPDILNFRDRAPSEEASVSLDAFLDQSNANAVKIEPGEDARLLLPMLDRISLVEVSFPVFGDGRGYSAARILREAGYTGELRGSGEILVDQINFLRRCGFDSFAPQTPLSPAAVDRALSQFSEVYQATGDGRSPVWALRHG